MADELHATGGLDTGARSGAPTPGRWSARSSRRACTTALVVAHHPRPGGAAVPRPPPHRRHRACCPASWASRRSPRSPGCSRPTGHVVAVEDVDFLAPVKFYRDEPRDPHDPRRCAGPRRTRPGRRLHARGRAAAAGRDRPQVTMHFTGARPARPAPPGPEQRTSSPSSERTRCCGRDDVYRALLPRPGLSGGRRRLAARRRRRGAAGDRPAGRPTSRRTPRRCSSRGWWSCASRPPGCGRSGTTTGSRCPLHIDRVAPLQRRPQVTGASSTPRPHPGDGGFDCAVVGLRPATSSSGCDGYRHGRSCPAPISDDVRAPACAR